MKGETPAPRGLAAFEASAVEQLGHELEQRERAARRHTLWAILGVSPAGLVPLIAATSDFGVAALLTGAVCITVVEAWRATRARADVADLRAEIRQRASSVPPTD